MSSGHSGSGAQSSPASPPPDLTALVPLSASAESDPATKNNNFEQQEKMLTEIVSSICPINIPHKFIDKKKGLLLQNETIVEVTNNVNVA